MSLEKFRKSRMVILSGDAMAYQAARAMADNYIGRFTPVWVRSSSKCHIQRCIARSGQKVLRRQLCTQPP